LLNRFETFELSTSVPTNLW